MSLFGRDKGEETVLKIEGMSCMHCVGKVEKGLKALEGVLSATRRAAPAGARAARQCFFYDPESERATGQVGQSREPQEEHGAGDPGQLQSPDQKKCRFRTYP